MQAETSLGNPVVFRLSKIKRKEKRKKEKKTRKETLIPLLLKGTLSGSLQFAYENGLLM